MLSFFFLSCRSWKCVYSREAGDPLIYKYSTRYPWDTRCYILHRLDYFGPFFSRPVSLARTSWHERHLTTVMTNFLLPRPLPRVSFVKIWSYGNSWCYKHSWGKLVKVMENKPWIFPSIANIWLIWGQKHAPALEVKQNSVCSNLAVYSGGLMICCSWIVSENICCHVRSRATFLARKTRFEWFRAKTGDLTYWLSLPRFSFLIMPSSTDNVLLKPGKGVEKVTWSIIWP